MVGFKFKTVNTIVSFEPAAGFHRVFLLENGGFFRFSKIFNCFDGKQTYACYFITPPLLFPLRFCILINFTCKLIIILLICKKENYLHFTIISCCLRVENLRRTKTYNILSVNALCMFLKSNCFVKFMTFFFLLFLEKPCILASAFSALDPIISNIRQFLKTTEIFIIISSF